MFLSTNYVIDTYSGVVFISYQEIKMWKKNAEENYRPIACLPLMWKLLTGMIAEETYNYLEREKLLPEEQKACKRGSRGTKDQLLIDKTVLKDCN